MSTEDWRRYVDATRGVAMTKAQTRLSLQSYPPHLERLLGMWKELIREPLRGVSSDGQVLCGLYDPAPNGAPVAEAAAIATRWLAALPPATRGKVCFPVDSELWRYWQNTPLILRDPQVELLELEPAQRELAMELVRVCLSPAGYSRTREVMDNNLFLGQLIGGTAVLNEWSFTLSLFGEPSSSEPWGWQLFGHHLALNCFFIGGRMTLSPVFMGLEPDHGGGEATRRLFYSHEQGALAMMRGLSDAQRERAVLYTSMLTADQPPGRYHPDDGRQVGGAFQDNRIVPAEGLCAAGLDQSQRVKLLDLAEMFIGNLPAAPSAAALREIERRLDRTYFAWIGRANDIDPFYFRIHSPIALIEFDHHSGIFLSNEDPARFHVHSIVREPNGGDYGRDLLKQHYARGGHDHAGGYTGSHTHGREHDHRRGHGHGRADDHQHGHDHP